jgi:hypothetical protein
MDRLFIGCYPTGIVYADRTQEKHGDYKRVAFLSYETLHLIWRDTNIPLDLRAAIVAHALTIQARRGQQFETSSCGQTVTLGQGV